MYCSIGAAADARGMFAGRAGLGQRDLRNRELDGPRASSHSHRQVADLRRSCRPEGSNGGHSRWHAETLRDFPGLRPRSAPSVSSMATSARAPLYALREAARAAAHGGAGDAGRDPGDRIAHPVGADPDHFDKNTLFSFCAPTTTAKAGIVALLALLSARNAEPGKPGRARLLVVGLVGAALLYGDGAITPAISVLSAPRRPEGRRAVTGARPWVPLTVIILIGLFAVQKKGARPSSAGSSGRSCSAGFLAIAALGLHGIARRAFRARRPQPHLCHRLSAPREFPHQFSPSWALPSWP